MLRLQPSVIGVTKTEFDDFLLNHGAHRIHAMRFAQEQAQPSLPLYALPVPTMRLRRGPERSRDESLTDSTLIASSPSAAMDDRDELELEMLANDTLDISIPGSPAGGPSTYRMRHDSVLEKDISQVPSYQNNNIPRLDSRGAMQLDGALPDVHIGGHPQETGRERRPAPSTSRRERLRRVRGSSDPGEFTPLAITRTRPSSGLERATTTGNLSTLLETNARRSVTPNWMQNTTVTPGSDNREHLRHTARNYAFHHSDRSPLDELIHDAERLNLHGSDTGSGIPLWSQSQRFPSFEDDDVDAGSGARTDDHLREAADPFIDATFRDVINDGAIEPEAHLSYEARMRLAMEDVTSLSPNAVRGGMTTPSAADRLLAFAASFTPRALQGSALAPQPNGPPAMPSQRRSPLSGNSPMPVLQRSRPLQGFAVVSGGRPLGASPRQARTVNARRVNAVEERENDDDTSEVEAEARFWRERVAIASTAGNGLEGRTPPSQGRFLRFLR